MYKKRDDILSMLRTFRSVFLLKFFADSRFGEFIPKSGIAMARLSTLTAIDGQTLLRLSHFFQKINLFKIRGGKVYLTKLAQETFVKNSLGSVTDFILSPEYIQAWLALGPAIRKKTSPFSHAHQLSSFEYFQKNELGQIFNRAMGAMGKNTDQKLADHVKLKKAQKLIVDLGGGEGGFLNAILHDHASRIGINFDIVKFPKNSKLAKNLSFQQGDFFQKVPSADIYITRRILHDWNDADVLKLLKNCHRSANSSAKMYCIEVIYDKNDLQKILMDLEMLVMTEGGFERSLPEFKALFKTSGWKFEKLIETGMPWDIQIYRKI